MSLQARVEALEERVAALENPRPKVPPVTVSQDHICGVDPVIDSATCPYASLYRRRKGCRGDACVHKATEYYDQYRATHAVAAPKRRR